MRVSKVLSALALGASLAALNCSAEDNKVDADVDDTGNTNTDCDQECDDAHAQCTVDCDDDTCRADCDATNDDCHTDC